METKKSVVKSVTMSRDKTTAEARKDSYGNYAFTVAFENGDVGFHTSKTDNPSYFTVGQEAEYTIETLTGKTGNPYNKIKRPSSGFQPGGGGGQKWQPKTPQQVKTESRSMLVRYAVDLFIADKIPYEKISETYKDLIVMYDASVDELTSGTA